MNEFKYPPNINQLILLSVSSRAQYFNEINEKKNEKHTHINEIFLTLFLNVSLIDEIRMHFSLD